MTQAYPLQWPTGRPRTKHPEPSRFQVDSLDKARRNLHLELRRLGAEHVVISTNRPTRNDGEFRAGSKEPDDAGVAVYFTLHGRPLCFACDRWQWMLDNLHAIALTIAALRGIDRWGVGEALDRAFAGFQALPAPAVQRAWHQVLGVSPEAGADAIRAARTRLAQRYHPDKGGPEASHERMAEVNAAAEEGLRLGKGCGA
jgi:hypothetical protein